MLRCKFRVLEIYSRMEAVCVTAKPVMPKGPNYPGGSAENAAYFAATPSGEYKEWLPPKSKTREPGDYLYIDILSSDSPGAEWKVDSVSHKEGRRVLSMTAADHKSSLEIDVTNEAAWPTIDAMKPGSKYRVVVTPAEAPTDVSWP